MMNDTANRRGLRKPWTFRIPISAQIWVFIFLMTVSHIRSQDSTGFVDTSSAASYSTVVFDDQTQSVDVSDIQVTATMMISATISSSTVDLPSNCCHVCVCNSSVMDSTGFVDTSSAASYSTVVFDDQTQSVDVSDIQVTATMMISATISSSTVDLPSNCYHVCVCNSSVMASVSMAYNMTEQVPYSMNMTPNTMSMSLDMTPMSLDTTSSTINVSLAPSPSIADMSYTATANTTTTSYNSSVWPTPSSSISTPFVCNRSSCWKEVECRTCKKPIFSSGPSCSKRVVARVSTTPYVASSASFSSSVQVSIAPTELPCPKEHQDCHGDCNGTAYNECGVCIKGNTGYSSLKDCENVCNGTAFNATCGVCLRQGAINPVLDCNNTCHGDAEVDSCEVCTGGNTGLTADYLKDACGVCDGDNSTCAGCDDVPNSGKINDACGICGGSGTTCTDIMKTIPRTIASCQPSILVFGAGLDGGVETVCALYDKDNMVVNTTATSRNLTHAQCKFEPWANYTAGEYNLSVTVVHNDKPDVKTNTSLLVYYYSCSNLSLTSASPHEVLIDELPRNVTLVGSGFFHWEFAETVCYFGSQTTRDVVFVNASALMCKIAAVDTSTHLSLSVSMDGGLWRARSANLTVFARAPNVTVAKFSETAAEILVLFDKDVEFVGEETCNVFFDSATVAKLGKNPECFLAATQLLEILLGTNATILVGENLVFENYIFKASDEKFSRYLSGSFPVRSPDSPLTPVPAITGPTTLSSCGNLTLAGFQSSGGGGRPLKFLWSLKSPGSGADATYIANILNVSKDADSILIPGTILTAGKTYEFELGVANFLNPSTFKKVTRSVIKAADPVPFLSLFASSDEGEIYVSEDLLIKVTADVAPCVNDTRVSFLWTVTCSDASAQQRVESSSSFKLTKTRATLSITKRVLTGDVTCTFNVTASMNYNPSVKSSATVDIKALFSPLQPAIVGGNRHIGVDDGVIKFDAKTRLRDPDESTQQLRCGWRCRDENDDSCFSAVEKGKLIFPSNPGCVFEVQSNGFTAGKTYTISVDLSKGSRTATTSIVLTVVAGNPPDVWLGEAKKTILAHERVALEGFYRASVQPFRVQWSCVRETGFAYVNISGLTLTHQYFADDDHDSLAFVIIPAGRLKKGSKYRFRLTVNDGSKDGVATMDVEVRSSPTSGSLTVDKDTVQALTEEVTMKAVQWTAEKNARPLRYAFGEIVEGDCELWGPPSNIPELKGIMPSGSGSDNILTLCVIVVDQYGSFALAKKNITSNPVALNADALGTLFSDTVENQFRSGNLDRALSSVRNIAETVKDSSDTSDELKQSISQKAQNFVVDYLDSAVVSQDNAFPLFTTLMNTNASAAENSSNMAGAAVKIIDGLGDKSLSNNQAEKFLMWVVDLAGDSLDDEDDTFLENVVTVADELLENLAVDLVFGDPAREVSDDRLGVMNVRVSDLKTELPISSKPGAPKFDPGEALARTFGTTRMCGGGKTCSGVILKLVQYYKNLLTEDPKNKNNDSEIVASQVIGLELNDPIDKKKLPVQGLSSPLKLKFSIGTVQGDREAACKFFNETRKLWISDGLTVIGPFNGTLTCESSHATFFAPSHDKKNAANANTTTAASPVTTVGAIPAEEKSYTGAIVGGVIGGVLFLFIVAGGIWWCSKKTKVHTGRVSPENPHESLA